MQHRYLRAFSALLVCGVLASACSFTGPPATPQAVQEPTATAASQQPTPGATAEVAQAQEGGVKRVSGSVTYTNPFFTAGVSSPSSRR
jgi:hypothetical protein